MGSLILGMVWPWGLVTGIFSMVCKALTCLTSHSSLVSVYDRRLHSCIGDRALPDHIALLGQGQTSLGGTDGARDGRRLRLGHIYLTGTLQGRRLPCTCIDQPHPKFRTRAWAARRTQLQVGEMVRVQRKSEERGVCVMPREPCAYGRFCESREPSPTSWGIILACGMWTAVRVNSE